ncbi:MAG: hypothetical protein ACU0DH_09970 [Paracoccus sp. (in: a-proteobacteria)]|uniref:hypothetical protein n=1 Tax=Paracoccus sp. TaxID=267 RepID=UPI004058C012
MKDLMAEVGVEHVMRLCRIVVIRLQSSTHHRRPEELKPLIRRSLPVIAATPAKELSAMKKAPARARRGL